jgi:hypothetical protein
MGGRSDTGLQRAEDACAVLSAVGDVPRGQVLKRQRLGECAKMCRAVSPLTRFRHGLWPGVDAGGPLRRAGRWGALASDERVEHTPARHSCESAQHGLEVQMQLRQGLWPGRPRLAQHLAQMVALAQKTPELTRGAGAETRVQARHTSGALVAIDPQSEPLSGGQGHAGRAGRSPRPPHSHAPHASATAAARRRPSMPSRPW